MSDSTFVRSKFFMSAMCATLVVLMMTTQARSDGGDETPTDVFPGVFKLTVTPNSSAATAGRQPFAEFVQFDNGNFTAEACAKLGFAPTAYVVKSVDGKTVFEVTLTSGQQGIQKWTGRRGVSALVGTLTWTKPDGDVFVYTFTGQSTDVPTEPVVED